MEPIKSQLNSCLLQMHDIYILLTNYTSLILGIQLLHLNMNLKGRFCSNSKLVHNTFLSRKEEKTTLFAYLIFVISFTQAAFSHSKFYTQKLTKNTPKHSKMSLKSKIYAVFVFNLENFTPGRIFLHGHRPWCP